MARNKRTSEEKMESAFAVRLRELMKQENYRQEDLAKKINRSRTTIAQYTTGASQPPYEVLREIAEVFDVTVDYLLGTPYATKTVNPSKSEVLKYLGLTEEELDKLVWLLHNKKLKKRLDDCFLAIASLLELINV